MITIELLKAINPKTRVSILEKYVDPITDICDYYEISAAPERIAGYLANIVHESGGFTLIKENLNYSAKGLLTTFGKYFPTDEIARQYERKPQMIANRVYANRMGNGPESSGDGWKFCGRGLIQLTGKDNYTRFSNALEISLDECIEYMETPEGAVSSSGWFWDNNNLNSYCDAKNWVMLTKRINGGLNGHEHRVELINKITDYINNYS